MKLNLFWKKVNKNGPVPTGRKELGPCWLWVGAKRGNGYGSFKVGKSLKQAHRVMYELSIGTIPNGLHVLHKCDNPVCVNPEHLAVGTHRQNMDDMVAKGRHLQIPYEVRLAIPAMIAGGMSQTEAAKKLGIDQSSISKILSGKMRMV